MRTLSFLVSLSCVLSCASLARAQEVKNIRAEHRAGQTFVTWRESSTAGTRYRVYRSFSPITSDAALAGADFLGEVDEKSSRNQGRSLATGLEHAWIIAPGAPELAQTDGLFVHTVEESTNRAYYAVTSVLNGSEDRRLKNGWNATASALAETPAAPQPVLQDSDAGGEMWGHWLSDRGTPFQPAMSLWPSRGFDFRFEPGSAAGPRGLVVRLHAAGQTYGQGWPQRFETPRDVDILAVSDLQPYTGWSFWFGTQEDLPGAPGPDTRVWNYTQERILWTLDWIAARQGSAHDRERVYATGGSMGAVGAMWLAGEAPERLAAILCRNGLYDLLADDYRNPDLFQGLFGRFTLGLLTREGLPILDRTNAVFMANRAPQEDWPVIRTLNGRNDETVGWESAVQLYAGLAQASRPAVHYFDEREHDPNGYWRDLERTLLARTFKTRRDRPSLRFDRCTLDDDAGDGRRDDGDPVGTINGYLDYDPETARAAADGLDLDVFLRDSGSLDDAPRATGWAALTPRRTGPFALRPGDAVRYTLSEGAAKVDEHVLLAGEHGLVHTPLVPLERAQRHARFERWSPGPEHLFLGRAAIPGDEFQAVVSGSPGAAWSAFIGLGDALGPSGEQLGLDFLAFHGVFGADGLAQVWLALPTWLPPGTWIWGRTLTAGRLWPMVGVPTQRWP